MKVFFTIYSSIVQVGFEETKAYEEALACDALLNIDLYNNELIASKMSDRLIHAVVLHHIENTEPQLYEDEMLPLNGGLRIEHDGIVIEHQCCSEINDYKNWKKILDEQSTEWKEIWIGHPSINYKIVGKEILFSQYYDTHPNQVDIKIMLTFNKDEFFKKLEIALAELNTFKHRLYSIINGGNFQNKQALSTKLIS